MREIIDFQEIEKMTVLRLKGLFQYNRSTNEYHQYFIRYNHKTRKDMIQIIKKIHENNIPIFTFTDT